MKICPKCGKRYADENMFCENCGSKLMFQAAQSQEKYNPDRQVKKMQNQNSQAASPASGKKKIHPLMFVIPVAVALVLLILLFLFWDKLPFVSQKSPEQETVRQESSDSEQAVLNESNTEKGENTESSESNSDETESDSEEKVSEKEASKEEKIEQGGRPEKEKTTYADVDINGIDNAYVQVVGTVARENGEIILKLQKAVSVCAYNAENDVIQKEKEESFILDEMDMEEYLGDIVEIKGKVSADFDGGFLLHPVKTERKKTTGEETISDSRYQLIQADVTWEEAFSDCINRGGALVRINSEEELKKITDLIEEQEMQNIHFYLGGRRDADSQSYFWVNSDNKLEDELLNPQGQSWAAVHWMENEPSFTSEGDTELYLNLIYYKENWVFNDVPSDITKYYPGKTGYICEFEK